MKTSEKISALRRLMKSQNLQAYYIPSSDPHQDEYVPDFWQRRKFISGFTGSAGDVVVTMEKAGLWTDSRYFLQAGEQLDKNVITLYKAGLPGVPTVQDWLSKELKKGETLGMDPQVISHQAYLEFEDRLQANNIKIRCMEQNLVDAAWKDRPPAPSERIQVLDPKFAGEKSEEKLLRLREKMSAGDITVHILSKLDEIAWLFNIRGSDIQYNPVVISYAAITEKEAFLYIDPVKITEQAKKALEGDVTVRPYEAFQDDLEGMAQRPGRILLDKTTISQWVVDLLSGEPQLVFQPSPVDRFKAIKNAAEISGMEDAHVVDGVAMVRFFTWMEKTVRESTVTEVSAAEKVLEFRSRSDLFVGPSFETISSYGEHGAVVHYAPTSESDIPLRTAGTYLIDSGGQYLNGTTDITRTIALGEPADEQKDRFTRVLKGVIALTTTSFPQGTVGKQLDTIARLSLWEAGLNYGHGTGHGIGHYLNVHEGPQAISYYRCVGVPLEPGMITSIEPGYYKEGQYGMRTENVALVVKNEEFSRQGQEFFTFQTLTLCPIDTRLIKKELLTDKDIAWINGYHQRVLETLSPHLQSDEKDWLKQATRSI